MYAVFIVMIRRPSRFSLALFSSLFSFFFNDTATTEIYTLSLHDALPIYARAYYRHGAVQRILKFASERPPSGTGAGSGVGRRAHRGRHAAADNLGSGFSRPRDRKSTRLNSSHT